MKFYSVLSVCFSTAGIRLHRFEPVSHGTTGQSGRDALKSQESKVPGFNFWIGLDNWPGYRLADYINYFLLIMNT